jgi:energy-coupling factor transporter ATP-binding protein EcfA2
MLDFLVVSSRSTKRGCIEIYPKFIIKKSSDLMIRGGDFYAIWNENKGLWCTDENDALMLIDKELNEYYEKNKTTFNSDVKVLHMWDAETGMIDNWHKYCQKQMRDNYISLDEKIIFSNSESDKKEYASKRLEYPLVKGPYSGFDKLIGTLYTPEERHKIEWAIGSIITGDSKHIQKFMVLYGSAGAGKSTILNIIQELFQGYYSVFDAKALGSSSNSFALEAFKSNPLIAIQHDGDLSRIEDNTRLNSLVSHELMTVNEKFKSTYASKFKAFLFMGTNKPVKITDAKSGLIRRLIDVSPSGNKLDWNEYNNIMSNIKFELSGIAYHCKEVFEANPNYYDKYIPINMLGASNDFYNFILDAYYIFSKDDSTTLKASWEMYKNYCADSNIQYPLSQRAFKEELRNYFNEFRERDAIDGTRVRNVYVGFKKDIFLENKKEDIPEKIISEYKIEFKDGIKSILDSELSECKAQLATEDEKPSYKWDNVRTKLSQIDTRKLHYVKVPLNHIVIDFDIPNKNGNKSFELNLEAASKWPKTYSELSKSGAGIHLHYIYTGDVNKLSRVYDEHVEVKVYNGNSSLRRKLTKCNDLPISEISSGLPLKKGDNMIDNNIIKNEKMLRIMIKKNLNKEIHQGTKPSVDFIYKILEDANKADFAYDVTDMRNSILAFAANSSHQADYCIKLVNKMSFKSVEVSDAVPSKKDEIIFFDVEVFPNLFLINWKIKGEGKPVVRMINPKSAEIEELLKFNLVGFNCRRYDNHMLYGCLMGYTNEQLYKLSQRIISGDKHAFFGEAYNLSYTDVYDFASAPNKQSLKKYEIQLGLKHHELGLPWDQPVPKEKWLMVAEYCDDDVLATEATFNYLENDWTARKILAKMAGMSVNDTTNTLSTRIVFGKNRKPQDEFNYRDMSKAVYFPDEIMWTPEEDPDGYFKDMKEVPFDNVNKPMYDFLKDNNILPLKFTAWNGEKSVLPFFPGYKFEFNKSTYRGEEVGEGGYVKAKPGIHVNVALLDVASMHPHSMISECLFGPKFTKRFMDLVNSRIAIKHNDTDTIKTLLDGLLFEVLKEGTYSTKALGNALKTPINSGYGLTSAQFENPFRDVRNKDNIVAKRGALFMIDLMKEVESLGFTVAHIKTDSIKIPNATPEIIDYVMKFGKKYGYTFEHEATYEKMCLVNDAVYIAKYATPEKCKELYGYVPGDCNDHGGDWTATGTQFQVPYVFKKLFSKEPIEFKDLCETKSVSSCMYMNMNVDVPNEEVKAEEMQFIGKVGSFCPMKKGYGGNLLREAVDKKSGNKKYGFVNGTKGYYWLESDMVKELNREEYIDRTVYNELVNDAIKAIEQYGDFERFVE